MSDIRPWSKVVCVLAWLIAATTVSCNKPEPAAVASVADDIGPPLSDMALPVSLRTGDSAPTSTYLIEATDGQLVVASSRVIKLDKGKVGDTDKADGVIPALATVLRASPRSAVSLRLQANLPYETVALILNTAKSAGINDAAFEVRAIGPALKTGWMKAEGFVMSSRADDLPEIPAVPAKTWDVFTNKWQAIHDACRTALTGNCAYVNTSFASGGSLRIELFTSGRGVNIDFFRAGLTPDQEHQEEVHRRQWLATKKDDFLQGRISHDDMEEILLLGDPATQALFQFRYEEALKSPSVVTSTMAPMCHDERCGIVLSSDMVAPLMHVLTLLGAAFPDGQPSPAIAFEMPWTKRRALVTPEWLKDQEAASELEQLSDSDPSTGTRAGRNARQVLGAHPARHHARH